MNSVKYIGTSSVRRISDRDWRAAGVPDQGTVTWSKVNGYVLGQDQFTDEAWAKLAEDPGMVMLGDATDAAAVHEASVEAAVSRLRARSMSGQARPAPVPVVTSVDDSEV